MRVIHSHSYMMVCSFGSYAVYNEICKKFVTWVIIKTRQDRTIRNTEQSYSEVKEMKFIFNESNVLVSNISLEHALPTNHMLHTISSPSHTIPHNTIQCNSFAISWGVGGEKYKRHETQKNQIDFFRLTYMKT